MTSVKLINHSSSTADWNYLIKFGTVPTCVRRTVRPGSILLLQTAKQREIVKFGKSIVFDLAGVI